MKQYIRNVTLWVRGFGRLRDPSRIRYKPGWGPIGGGRDHADHRRRKFSLNTNQEYA